MDKTLCPTSNLKKNYSKKLFEGKKGVKLSDFRSVHGEVRSRISKDLREYSICSQELHQYTLPYYQKIEELGMTLCLDIEKVSDTISSICKNYQGLILHYKKFNNIVTEGRWTCVETLYEAFHDSLNTWGRLYLTRRPNQKHLNWHHGSFDTDRPVLSKRVRVHPRSHQFQELSW